MPIEINIVNKECPNCKNPSMFRMNSSKFYCRKCGNEIVMGDTDDLPITMPEDIKNEAQEGESTNDGNGNATQKENGA